MSSGPPGSIKLARDLFDLTGRTAIITGGSVGLGRQMAEGLAEMGANLPPAGSHEHVTGSH
jgi:hypothetical protein